MSKKVPYLREEQIERDAAAHAEIDKWQNMRGTEVNTLL
jgi:hypothetical protein